MSTAQRLQRACDTLRALYPLLFAATAAPTWHPASGRAGPAAHAHAPVRLDVLDAIRDVNQAVLQLRAEIAGAMGYGTAPVWDLRYYQSAMITDALDWIAAAAWTLEHQGLAGEVLDRLQGDAASPIPQARRVLGLAERPWPFDLACPVAECAGTLLGLPNRGVVVCTSCRQRWRPPDWEGLGRAARARTEQLAEQLAARQASPTPTPTGG